MCAATSSTGCGSRAPRRAWTSCFICSSSFRASRRSIISGWKYAARSWRYGEVSVNSPAGIPIYQFKSVIVAAGLLLFIQGIAQVFRCIICMRDGRVAAPNDVEETETSCRDREILHVRSEAMTSTTSRDARGAVMTDPQVALLMLGVFIFVVFLGFPIAFTLMAMGVGFGYYAYFEPSRMWRTYNGLDETAGWWDSIALWLEGFFNNRIFDLFINQTYYGDVERGADRRSRCSCSWDTSSNAPTSSTGCFTTLNIARATFPARWAWRRLSHARSSPPRPASSARW